MRGRCALLVLPLAAIVVALAGCGGGGGGTDTTPTAPTEPTVVAPSGTSVTFGWTDTSTTETGFEVQRAVAGVWATIGETAKNVVTYTDTGLTSGTLYSYRVRALGASGDSAWSPYVEIAPGTVAPTAPSNLRSTSVATSSVDLAWDDNSSTEDSFQVQRQEGAGSWTTLGTTSAGVTTYTDSTVSAATTYNYRVRASLYGVGSTWAGPLEVTTPDPDEVGTVTGTVASSSTSAAISGATVKVGTRSTTTASDGTFTVADVDAGSRAIVVSASGYTSYSGTVTVVAGGTTSVGTISLALSGDGPPPPPF
jgi:hypothetical protein